MPRRFVGRTLASASLLLAAAGLARMGAAESPTQAAPIADSMLQAMGGQAAWDGTHFIHFTFAGRRTHTWDKWTGRHRLEGKTKEGEPYVVLDNVNTHDGAAYLNGKQIEGDKAQEMVKNAYAAWVNDTYWLLMPYKIRDPGVNLAYDGPDQVDGKSYDKLSLTFGQVGLTPGDHYWVWINRDTHLMDRWAYLLQDEPRDKAPTAWQWQGWQRYGKIMLAPSRVQPGGDKKLELSDIQVLDQVPDKVFTSPEPAGNLAAAAPVKPK